MSITELSTEILQTIYEHAGVQDVIHLAQTSKKNYEAFLGQRLQILELALNNSYSPLPELLKLVIANEPDKNRQFLSTELRRNTTVNSIIKIRAVPKLTIELIIKMVQYGKVADRWSEVYPRLQWRHGHDCVNRRFLRSNEQERLRGAIYRYWTYNTLFHDELFTHHDPDLPQSPTDPRLRILRTYTTFELVQLTEFHDKIQEMVQLDLFPANWTVRGQALYPLSSKAVASMGWGEDEPHMALVDDLMKFSPADFLHLYEHTTTKAQRLEYFIKQGKQFMDAPATLRNSINLIHQERKTGVDFKTYIFEEIKFGLLDYPDCHMCADVCRETHPWATDASSTGEQVLAEEEESDSDDDETDFDSYGDL
jgi:hypothetical protein